MFKVSFQKHGGTEILERFFSTRLGLDMWLLEHDGSFSFCKVQEVFH